jgi:hypothetical protein
MDLEETVLQGAEWIYVVPDMDKRLAVVNTVMNLLVP